MPSTVVGAVILTVLYPVVLDCMAPQRPRVQPGCCQVSVLSESAKDDAMVRRGVCVCVFVLTFLLVFTVLHGGRIVLLLVVRDRVFWL